jgi:uncharacterized membrane protein
VLQASERASDVLAPAGALAAVLVGWGTLASSFRAGLTLLAFFFSSSKLTHLGDDLKADDEEHKLGGQRDWKQVRCSLLACRQEAGALRVVSV